MIKINKLILWVTLILLVSIVGCTSSEDRAEELYQKGMSLLDKDPKEAANAFKNALLMKKNMPKAIYGMALVAKHQDDSVSAFDFMNQVLEVDPNHIEALTNTCEFLLDNERLDLALDRCDHASEIDPKNILALYLRAALQLKLDDAKGAVEYAKRTLSLDSANQEAYLTLATERLMAKDEPKAIEYLNKALIINEKNLKIQLIKTITLENISKVQEADESYRKIIQLLPDSILAKKSYIYFLLRHGRNDVAEQQLRAIAQFSSPKEIQAKLDVVRFVTRTKGARLGQAELESFVKNEPANYGLAFVLLNLYRAQNESAKEDALLNAIVERAGDTPDGYRARGKVAEKLIRLGEKSNVYKVLNQILYKDKRNEQALVLKAGLALEAKDYEAAITDLRTVVSDSPKSSSAALMLATAYEHTGLSVQAEEQYKNAFVSSGFSSVYGVPYADFLSRINQPARADVVLKQMRNVSAEDVISSGNTSPESQIYNTLSFSKNDKDGSLSAYMHANETDAVDVESILAIIRTYMQAGKNREALDFIEDILVNNPNIDVALLQGKIYAVMGNSAKAIEVVSDIVKTYPKYSYASQQLALLQLNFKLNDDAERTVSRALSFLPDDFELKLMKAHVFETTGRDEEAVKVYESMLEERPSSKLASGHLAELLAYRSDSANMNRAYELAKMAKDSRIPEFLDTYGWICYKLGKLDEAEKTLNSAVYKKPKIAVYRYHLAKVYIAKKDRTKAREALEMALINSKNQQFEQSDEVNQLLETL